MKNILSQFLEKKGVKSVDELDNTPNSDGSPTERQTYEGWNAVLSKKDLTLEDVKNFCQDQINLIETKWKDYSLEQSKKAELIPYHSVYKSIFSLINTPQSTRENLEKHLKNLLNN